MKKVLHSRIHNMSKPTDLLPQETVDEWIARVTLDYGKPRDPDKQCMKCGRDLVWVRTALVCVEHGYTGKGC